MVEIIEWVVARAREPSTYAGLAGVLAAFHIADASSWAHVLTTFGVGAAGVIAMFMKEKGFGK